MAHLSQIKSSLVALIGTGLNVSQLRLKREARFLSLWDNSRAEESRGNEMKSPETIALSRLIAIILATFALWKFADHFSYVGVLEERSEQLEEQLKDVQNENEKLQDKVKRAVEVLSE
jgi:hypothetical protein